MKKVLILASVASMIDQFTMPNIHILIKKGFKVHVAANFEEGNTSSPERITEFKKELEALGVIFFQIEFSREITNVHSNFRAYRQIKKLMLQNDYSFVHCHSPIGGVCGRLAGRATGIKVIYTAHGFHFFKGAPIINWLLYYPVEHFLARYTDVLVTINKEDYAIARKFKAKKVKYVPGVGIDTQGISRLSVNKPLKRKEIGVPEDALILLSAGELNRNKNHETIIRALSLLKNKKIHYVICGHGPLETHLREIAQKLNLDQQVHLLGFRNDVLEICKVADIFVFPSKREGLGLAALEAMASGLPLITSNIHGMLDYSVDGLTGYSCTPSNAEEFAVAINRLAHSKESCLKMGQHNTEAVKRFDISESRKAMEELYNGL